MCFMKCSTGIVIFKPKRQVLLARTFGGKILGIGYPYDRGYRTSSLFLVLQMDLPMYAEVEHRKSKGNMTEANEWLQNTKKQRRQEKEGDN